MVAGLWAQSAVADVKVITNATLNQYCSYGVFGYQCRNVFYYYCPTGYVAVSCIGIVDDTFTANPQQQKSTFIPEGDRCPAGTSDIWNKQYQRYDPTGGVVCAKICN